MSLPVDEHRGTPEARRNAHRLQQRARDLLGLLAAKRGLDSKTVYEDLKANIIPGISLVPGMVIAVEQAQRAGLTYHRQ